MMTFGRGNDTELTNAVLAKLREYFAGQPYGGIVTRAEMPELMTIAPCCGHEVRLAEFRITRRTADQLDQFTIAKDRPPPCRCAIHNTRLGPDGKCWWCDNPEPTS